MSNYITEAFKQLNLLEDANDVMLDASGVEEIRSFLDDAAVDPDDEMMDIYDLEAEAKEDLKKSYEGKVVLECTVCHSHIFEDPENISMDEDGEACKEIECPYCMSNEGYFIIGEIAPFNQEQADSFAEDDELDEIDIEGAADDVDEEDIIEESYRKKGRRRGLKESADDKIWGDYKDRCADCIALVDVNGEWCCDEKGDMPCRKVKVCPEGLGTLRFDKIDVNESCNKKLKEDWGEEFESEYDAIVNDKSLSKEEQQAALNRLYADFGLSESMKLDGIKELYDNDEIRGVEELEGVDELEGVEALHGDKHEAPINEDIEDVSVTTSDETMTMTTKEDGGVVIETSPKENSDFESDDFDFESNGDEMLAPVSDETSEIIDVATDALDSEDEEDFETLKSDMEEESEEDEDLEEPAEDLEDFEEFDEESFNGLGESYLKRCYENVKGFKTTGVSTKGKKLFIEGIIKFDSGNIKETQFVFESLGKGKFEGYNKQISRGKKTYKLNSSKKNGKLVCESLNYNYRSRNNLNESVRVYGTVKRK